MSRIEERLLEKRRFKDAANQPRFLKGSRSGTAYAFTGLTGLRHGSFLGGRSLQPPYLRPNYARPDSRLSSRNRIGTSDEIDIHGDRRREGLPKRRQEDESARPRTAIRLRSTLSRASVTKLVSMVVNSFRGSSDEATESTEEGGDEHVQHDLSLVLEEMDIDAQTPR